MSSASAPPKPAGRSAVKVNPVTGAMTAVAKRPPGAGGKRMDGCVAVDEKYLHAALDAGLGGRDGMYGHMTSIKRAVHPGTGGGVEVSGGGGRRRGGGGDLGGGYADDDEEEDSGPRGPARVATIASLKKDAKAGAPGGGATSGGGGGGGDAGKGHGRIRQVVHGHTRGVGPVAPGIHAHESSFLRAKGVVNTLGGATDLNRKPRGAGTDAEAGGSKVKSLGDYAPPASKRAAAAAAAAPKGKGVVHTLGGTFDASVKATPGAAAVVVRDGRVGGAGSVGARAATSRAVKATARSAAAAPPVASGRVGSGAGSGSTAPVGADSLRAKRAEFFAAKFAAADGAKENAAGSSSSSSSAVLVAAGGAAMGGGV
jgi:hypothetical protein